MYLLLKSEHGPESRVSTDSRSQPLGDGTQTGLRPYQHLLQVSALVLSSHLRGLLIVHALLPAVDLSSPSSLLFQQVQYTRGPRECLLLPEDRAVDKQGY